MLKKYFLFIFLYFPLGLVYGESDLKQENRVVSFSGDLTGMRTQGASNLPDISIVGDFCKEIFKSKGVSGEIQKSIIREIELSFQGYIYPEIRADVFFTMHRHEGELKPELCEGYVSFLRVLEGLSLKAGKIHVDFGKINKIHQHERPYIDQPEVINNFFGEHGLVGEGLNLSYLLPLPVFLQLDVGVWCISEHEHHFQEIELSTPLTDSDGNNIEEVLIPQKCEDEFYLAGDVIIGRVWSSFSLGEISELEVGLSNAMGKGSHYLEHKDDVTVSGIDLTLKIWPSTYSRFIIQGELLLLKRVVPVGELKRYGSYIFLGYQFNKYWDIGVRYDISDSAFPENQKTNLVSTIITKKLTETTKMRLQYLKNLDTKIDTGIFQIVFGIGPHSHPLQ